MSSLISEVNATCLDLLLIEMVPLAIRVTKDLENENVITKEENFEETDLIGKLNIKDGATKELNIDDKHGRIDLLEDQDNLGNNDVIYRIESYGYNIGLRVGELLNYKLNNDEFANGLNRQNLKLNMDILNIMKFICRDIWKNLYGKQMDNLRTNHRGAFVLIDHNFKGISKMNSAKGEEITNEKIKTYLWFPCGIIRGILSSLGVDSSIQAEITQFPGVSFNIQTKMQT
ncbi:Trs33 protein [Saccharomycopsis crataegensis]|uniref:Trs33 protein n=1 Tax=Saccharomycopsis crataegensis TaxID=43959 RepID=A0AAV5QVB3_9ASCO|nr:Trs33 protein [Saccharomycopsis crataegensis]